MQRFFGVRALFVTALLLCTMLLACRAAGPERTLENVANALKNNDSTAFLAQLDMKALATNHVKSLTQQNKALKSLDSLGRMLGMGGMEDVFGNVLDVQTTMHDSFVRGVSTGELQAQCRRATTPDCPWVAESLRGAQVKSLGETAAVARVTTPEGMSSWLALRKQGENWRIVGQAILEDEATAFAKEEARPKKTNDGVREL